jgi:hypothetical protein
MRSSSFSAVLVTLLLMMFFHPPAAIAEDIPLLTWESGKVQSVVLGTLDSQNAWQVFLSVGEREYGFNSSRINSNGYQTFERTIPADIEAGEYQLLVRGTADKEPKLVAYIQIVEPLTVTPTRAPWSLNAILLLSLLYFLHALHTRVNRSATYLITQFDLEDKSSDGENGRDSDSLITVKSSLILKFRKKFIENFSWGLFHSLLKFQESTLFMARSHSIAILPIISVITAVLLSLTIDNQGWSAPEFVILLAILVFISTINLLSGIFASLIIIGWSSFLFLRGEGDLAGILAMILFSSIFMIPAYLVLTNSILNSHQSGDGFLRMRSGKEIFLAILFPIFAILVFNSSQDKPADQIDQRFSFIFSLTVFLSWIALQRQLKAVEKIAEIFPSEKLDLYPGGRHLSSTLFITSFFLVFIFVYLWTENFVGALTASFSWTLPLLTSRIKISPGWYSRFPLEKINFLAISFISLLYFSLIYLVLSQLPILISDRALILIIITPAPLYLTALWLLMRETRMAQLEEIR